MIAGADIVAAARGWVGTPFRHQGRLRGVGCDCLGLVLGVARELGALAADPPAYPHVPPAGMLEAACSAHLRPVPAAAPGDVLLIRAGGAARHLGFASVLEGEPAIIHALAMARGVVEHRLGHWTADVAAAFRLPGVR